MHRIAGITLREIRMPLTHPFRISTGTTRERRILLLELEEVHGARGWGECVAGEAPTYSSETVDTAWLALTRWIAPLVLGHEWTLPRELFDLLARRMRGHLMARAALEMAAWDLAAVAAGKPLAELLGGTRDTIEVGISLGIEDAVETLLAGVAAAREAGYRRVKLKIEPGWDLGVVREVRNALGPDFPLSVDANGAYQPGDTELFETLDAFGLLMIEQPLAFDDLLRHARLQRRLSTPICLDESITGVDRTADMIALGSGRIVNVKPGRVGGHTPSLGIHDLAREYDVPVWCGGMLETGIGRGHNVALASLENFRLPGDISPSARYWERDIVSPAWSMTQGRITVPRDRPGIGVEIDRDYVEHLTVRRETLRPD